MIDGLRGLAVMGIALMNVVGFALPEGAYFNPHAAGGSGPADMIAWGVNFLLVDGKMRNLFSFLFGASLLLIVDGARAGGGSAAAVHYRRMAALFLFGAAHLWLLWWGDILTHYALIGAVAFLFVDRPPEKLAGLALTCFLVQVAMGAMLVSGLYRMEVAALAPGAPAQAVRAWIETRATIGVGSPALFAREVALYRGSWGGIVAHLWATQALTPVWLVVMGGAETLGLMLLGMAAFRSGFLTGAWGRDAYLRVAGWGYGIGLTGTAALLALCVWSRFDSLTVFAAAMLGGTPFRPMIMAGHAALAIVWLGGGDMSAGLRARIAAAGRAAFTNYLGSSLVFGALFYGLGLGLFARLDRWMLYPVVLGLWALMLLWSRPWLARFRYGPLEWAWRSLSRGALQPMRRAAAG